MHLRYLAAMALIACLAIPTSARAEIVWVGATSTDVFDEANWDLTGSSVAVIDPNVTILDDVRIGAGPFDNNPEIPNEGGQVRLQLGDGNRLTVDGGILAYVSGGNDGVGGEPSGDADTANDGIAGPIVDVINGGQFQPFFVVNDVRVNVDGTSSATFGGGGVPVNMSSINLEPGATLAFLAETDEAFRTEHLAKLFVGGAPAVEGVNFTLAAAGTGSVITAVPEPTSLALLALASLGMLLIRRDRS